MNNNPNKNKQLSLLFLGLTFLAGHILSVFFTKIIQLIFNVQYLSNGN
jgi:hypothetical protein